MALILNPNGCLVTPINYGQTLSGSLTNTDCVTNSTFFADSYTFFGVGGQPIAISMSSSAVDSFLILLAPGGSLVTFDDNGGGGFNARIPPGSSFGTLPLQNGLYTIIATSNLSFQTGSYSITLSVPISSTTVTNTNASGPGRLRTAIL